MAAVEVLEQIRHQAIVDFGKITSEEGWLGSAPEAAFGVSFGRDSALSSLLALHTFEQDPHGAYLYFTKNSLRTMAKYQGKFFDAKRDEEPGRIHHELRFWTNTESANQQKLSELALANWPVDEEGLRVYPSVDSTPLFVIAACEYIKRSGDWQFAEEVSENIRNAVDWMIHYGDKDRDLLIEFLAQNPNTIQNQGWMDSGDSIKNPDGTKPEGPYALVEVQGYQYMALMLAADFFEKDSVYSELLRQRARDLKMKFNRDFWMEDENFFASGLDGQKNQIKELRSNVGHLLMTGIIDEEKVPFVVKRLMQPDMFCEGDDGGGIRTLSSNSPNFSDQAPSGYHNGSIWPHDNAVIYLGLQRYGYLQEAEREKNAVLDAQKHLADLDGLYDRELYMVDRRGRLKPYPTAQHPQGWVVNANLLWTAELESVKQAT